MGAEQGEELDDWYIQRETIYGDYVAVVLNPVLCSNCEIDRDR